MTLFFIQLQEITEAYAKTETINQLIEKTQPRGFGKNMLEKSCELKNNKITFYFKNKINLKKNQIREFEFLPENKPSGFQIKKNIYLKPRVSVGYLMQLMEDVNNIIGIYDNAVQEEINERIGKTEENLFEGGVEISWYF